MSHQLWYTSAERGLTPGSRGFCTVKATRGIPQPLAQRLESLSGYTHLFSPKANGNPDNPVAYHFIHFQQGGRTWYVLSRVCDAGLDYSGRTNKFAHHVVLDRDDLPPAGPAWLMSQPGFFDEAWDGTVGIVDGRKPIARYDRPPAPCERWQQAAGDAGWAGVLAETAFETAAAPAHIIVPPHASVLPLLEEALALLPPEVRWSTTFSTFFTDQFPADVSPRWRVLIDGTREAARATAIRHQLVINLTQPRPVPTSIQTPSVEAARQGTFLRPAATAAEIPHPAEALPFPEQAIGMNRTLPAGSPPPVLARRAAFPPPDFPPRGRRRISPIGTSKDYAIGPSIRNVILVGMLPLMLLLGVALGIAVQKRWLGTPSSEVAHNKYTEQAPAENENQGKTAAGAGDGAANPPEKSSPSQDGKKSETAAEGSAAGPDQIPSSEAEGGKTEAKSPGGVERPKDQGAAAPPENTNHPPGERQSSAASPESGESSPATEERSAILDATKPQWTIRQIDHPLSKEIKIGVIEKCDPGKWSEPSDGFALLIDGDRLIPVKQLPSLGLKVEPDSSQAPANGTVFPLKCKLQIPSWLFSALSSGNNDWEVELMVDEIIFNLQFDGTTPDRTGVKAGKHDVACTMKNPWKVGLEQLHSLKTDQLTFDIMKGTVEEQGTQSKTFECDAKFKLDEEQPADAKKPALLIEIQVPIQDIPVRTAKDIPVRTAKVTVMKGRMVITLIIQEPNKRSIRLYSEEWTYSGQ